MPLEASLVLEFSNALVCATIAVSMKKLYYGDNLQILRDEIADESVESHIRVERASNDA